MGHHDNFLKIIHAGFTSEKECIFNFKSLESHTMINEFSIASHRKFHNLQACYFVEGTG